MKRLTVAFVGFLLGWRSLSSQSAGELRGRILAEDKVVGGGHRGRGPLRVALRAMVLQVSRVQFPMTARKPLATMTPGFVLALSVGVATAGSLEIVRQEIACVLADRFPRIEALLTPADQVSLARVLFRTKDSEGWYWVRMDREADRFGAVLPKPRKGLKDFRYYIEANDTGFETSRTPEYVPEVVADPGMCRDKMVAKTVASANVIIHVPTGHKVSPVPSGFSVRGTLRAGEEKLGVFPNMSLTTALLAAGAVGAGAAAVGLSAANPANVPQGTVTILASSPSPGSTISLSTGSLAMTLRIVAAQDVLSGLVVVGLFSQYGSIPCVTFSSPHADFPAGTSQDVTINGPLISSSPCGRYFSVNAATVTLQGNQGILVISVAGPVNYSFVP